MQLSQLGQRQQFQDLDDTEEMRWKSQGQNKASIFMNSHSIQEEEDEYSNSYQSSKNKIFNGPRHLKLTTQLQPVEQDNYTVRAPTIQTIQTIGNLMSINSVSVDNRGIKFFDIEQSNCGMYEAEDLRQIDLVQSQPIYSSIFNTSFMEKRQTRRSNLNTKLIKSYGLRFVQKLKSFHLSRKVDLSRFDELQWGNTDKWMKLRVFQYYQLIIFNQIVLLMTLFDIIYLPLKIGFNLQLDGDYIINILSSILFALDLFIYLRHDYLIRLIQLFLFLINIPDSTNYIYGMVMMSNFVFIALYKLNRQGDVFFNDYLLGFSDSFTKFSIFKYSFILLITIHYFACMWHGLTFDNQDNWLISNGLNDKPQEVQYLYSLFWATSLIFHYDNGGFLIKFNDSDTTPRNQDECIFGIITMFYGYIIFIISITNISHMMNKNYDDQIKLNRIIYKLTNFMDKNAIEDSLKRNIQKCLHNIEKEESENKNEVFSLIKKLPFIIQEDLQLQIRRNAIKKVLLFKKFTEPLIQKLVVAMDYVSFIPEENILFENFNDDCSIYVIISGTVKVQFFGQNQSHAIHTFDTIKFGFITGLARSISVTSEGYTQAFKIRREDFLQYILEYQDDKERFFMMRDNILLFQNEQFFKCEVCQTKGHLCSSCPSLHYRFDRQLVIQKYNFPHVQIRSTFIRSGLDRSKKLKIDKSQVPRMDRYKNPRSKSYLDLMNDAAKLLQSRIVNEIPTSSYAGPSSSQLPYDFNDSRVRESVNSNRFINAKPGQEQNNSFPAQDLFQDVEFNDIPLKSDLFIEDEDEVIQNYIRKPQIKHTVRTAGFPQKRFRGFGMHESSKKDKFGSIQDDGLAVANIVQSSNLNINLMQQKLRSQKINNQPVVSVKMGRSKQPRLTFMYHNQQSGQSRDESSRQDSYRQPSRQNSNRSLTYSNNRSISNNPSNNPSQQTRKKTVSPSTTSIQNNPIPRQTSGTVKSNSHSHSGHQSSGQYHQQQQQQYQQQQQQQQQQQRQVIERLDSEQNLTEKQSQMRKSNRKKSTVNTRVSIMNQMSGFIPFILPDNPLYNNPDWGMSKFERMKTFKVFFPHNNYDKVLVRLNRFLNQGKKLQMVKLNSPYANSSFASRKIQLIKKILNNPVLLLSGSKSNNQESDYFIRSIKKTT